MATTTAPVLESSTEPISVQSPSDTEEQHHTEPTEIPNIEPELIQTTIESVHEGTEKTEEEGQQTERVSEVMPAEEEHAIPSTNAHTEDNIIIESTSSTLPQSELVPHHDQTPESEGFGHENEQNADDETGNPQDFVPTPSSETIITDEPDVANTPAGEEYATTERSFIEEGQSEDHSSTNLHDSQQEVTASPVEIPHSTSVPHKPDSQETFISTEETITPDQEVHIPETFSSTSAPTMGEVPGEGSCLVDRETYTNNSVIPPASKCQTSCRCISSIVHCTLVNCSPPPPGMKNCAPHYKDNECCPSYFCDGEDQPALESGSHVTESPPGAVNKIEEFPTVSPVQSIDDDMQEAVPEQLTENAGVAEIHEDHDVHNPENEIDHEIKPTGHHHGDHETDHEYSPDVSNAGGDNIVTETEFAQQTIAPTVFEIENNNEKNHQVTETSPVFTDTESSSVTTAHEEVLNNEVDSITEHGPAHHNHKTPTTEPSIVPDESGEKGSEHDQETEVTTQEADYLNSNNKGSSEPEILHFPDAVETTPVSQSENQLDPTEENIILPDTGENIPASHGVLVTSTEGAKPPSDENGSLNPEESQSTEREQPLTTEQPAHTGDQEILVTEFTLTEDKEVVQTTEQSGESINGNEQQEITEQPTKTAHDNSDSEVQITESPVETVSEETQATRQPENENHEIVESESLEPVTTEHAEIEVMLDVTTEKVLENDSHMGESTEKLIENGSSDSQEEELVTETIVETETNHAETTEKMHESERPEPETTEHVASHEIQSTEQPLLTTTQQSHLTVHEHATEKQETGSVTESSGTVNSIDNINNLVTEHNAHGGVEHDSFQSTESEDEALATTTSINQDTSSEGSKYEETSLETSSEDGAAAFHPQETEVTTALPTIDDLEESTYHELEIEPTTSRYLEDENLTESEEIHETSEEEIIGSTETPESSETHIEGETGHGQHENSVAPDTTEAVISSDLGSGEKQQGTVTLRTPSEDLEPTTEVAEAGPEFEASGEGEITNTDHVNTPIIIDGEQLSPEVSETSTIKAVNEEKLTERPESSLIENEIFNHVPAIPVSESQVTEVPNSAASNPSQVVTEEQAQGAVTPKPIPSDIPSTHVEGGQETNHEPQIETTDRNIFATSADVAGQEATTHAAIVNASTSEPGSNNPSYPLKEPIDEHSIQTIVTDAPYDVTEPEKQAFVTLKPERHEVSTPEAIIGTGQHNNAETDVGTSDQVEEEVVTTEPHIEPSEPEVQVVVTPETHFSSSEPSEQETVTSEPNAETTETEEHEAATPDAQSSEPVEEDVVTPETSVKPSEQEEQEVLTPESHVKPSELEQHEIVTPEPHVETSEPEEQEVLTPEPHVEHSEPEQQEIVTPEPPVETSEPGEQELFTPEPHVEHSEPEQHEIATPEPHIETSKPEEQEVSTPEPHNEHSEPDQQETVTPEPNVETSEPEEQEVSTPEPHVEHSEPEQQEIVTPEPHGETSEPEEHEVITPEPDVEYSEPDQQEIITPEPPAETSEPEEHEVSTPEPHVEYSEPDQQEIVTPEPHVEHSEPYQPEIVTPEPHAETSEPEEQEVSTPEPHVEHSEPDQLAIVTPEPHVETSEPDQQEFVTPEPHVEHSETEEPDIVTPEPHVETSEPGEQDVESVEQEVVTPETHVEGSETDEKELITSGPHVVTSEPDEQEAVTSLPPVDISEMEKHETTTQVPTKASEPDEPEVVTIEPIRHEEVTSGAPFEAPAPEEQFAVSSEAPEKPTVSVPVQHEPTQKPEPETSVPEEDKLQSHFAEKSTAAPALFEAPSTVAPTTVTTTTTKSTTKKPTSGYDYQKPEKPAPEKPQKPIDEYDTLDQEKPEVGQEYLPTDDYDQEEEEQPYGPGTCRYAGKVYVSAQQIPRDDPCDFCFCFRSDIICLQQSCPPPIPGCHDEPISGFCCPRYECHVRMATMVNVTSTTTTTTTTLPPHFLSHAYKGAAARQGCLVQGRAYSVGQSIASASGPCMDCICGGDGSMKCEPKVCTPEPMIRQMMVNQEAALKQR